MKTITIFNGPPSSGKDTLAARLSTLFRAPIVAFKDDLIADACSLFSIPPTLWDERYEHSKEKPWALLPKIDGEYPSQRRLLQYVSESVMKPLFGKAYYGKRLATRLEFMQNHLTFCSDGGFAEEIQAIAHTGIRVIVVRLHRPSCTFVGDTRQYIENSVITTLRGLGYDVQAFDISNEGTLEEFYQKGRALMQSLGYAVL